MGLRMRFIAIFFLAFISLHATHTPSDSTSFAAKLRKGRVELHTRNFFMSTVNAAGAPDYFAFAAGMGAAWESPTFKGFYGRFSGFFVFDLWSSDFSQSDPVTGISNRYELTLFDMQDPTNRSDLDRLEELLIGYKYQMLHIRLGRQVVNTPFLNEQDNRMRPNLVNGLSTWIDKGKWHGFLGWYNAVTPRGTVNWFSTSESFGVYPFGRNEFGQPSGFAGHTRSAGIGVAGLTHISKTHDLKFWNFWAENVFLMHFAEFRQAIHLKSGYIMHLGAQGLYQQQSGEGGNPEPVRAYFPENNVAIAGGGRFGLEQGKNLFQLNYLRIADRGAFFFPREWGREQFFVSMPRERLEGTGNVHAVNLTYTRKLKEGHIESGVGHYELPGVNNFALNRYGVPSFGHVFSRYRHVFKGYLSGLILDAMVVHKWNMETPMPDLRYRINRVDMWNFSVVANYHF
jgi:hypothetical protein